MPVTEKPALADALEALAKRAAMEVTDPEKLRLVKRYLRLAGESL